MVVKPAVSVASSKRELLENAIRRAGEHLEGLKEPNGARGSHGSEYPFREEAPLAPWLEAKISDLEASLKAHERAASPRARKGSAARRRA